MSYTVKRVRRARRRRVMRAIQRSHRAVRFALAALVVLGALGALGAVVAAPQAPDALPGAAGQTHGPENVSFREALVALPVAGALGAVLAFRPQRRGTPPRQPAVIQTQIILALVGALVMLVVGASLARAFGIVGAASLVRYRAKVDDPKDAGIMLVVPRHRAGLGRRHLLGGHLRDVRSSCPWSGCWSRWSRETRKEFAAEDQGAKDSARAARRASRPCCATARSSARAARLHAGRPDLRGQAARSQARRIALTQRCSRWVTTANPIAVEWQDKKSKDKA